MKTLFFLLLVLFLISTEIPLFSQTYAEDIDSTINRNYKIEKLSDIYLAPLIYDYNPEIPLKMEERSLNFYLLNKNFEDHLEGLNYRGIPHLHAKPLEYLFLVQQIDYLHQRLMEMHKFESSQLKFAIENLGYSKDLASMLILFIHLSNY